MSSRRVVVAGLAAWLAVMVVGSVLVWAVIGRVGQHLESSEQPLVGTGSTPVAAVSPGGKQTSGRPHATASGKPTRSASANPSSSPTSAPSSTPSSPATKPSSSQNGGSSGGQGGPGGGPSSSPTKEPTKEPTSQPTGGSTPTPQVQRRTWSGVPGLVTVECRGTTASLVAAQPASGFRVEVKDRGPSRVEVRYEGTGDEDEREWDVEARCVGGAPSFSVEADDD